MFSAAMEAPPGGGADPPYSTGRTGSWKPPQWRHPPEGVRTPGTSPHRFRIAAAAMEAPPGGGADTEETNMAQVKISRPQWRHPPEGVRTYQRFASSLE